MGAETLTPEQEINAARMDLQCTRNILGHAVNDLRRAAGLPANAPAPLALTFAENRARSGDARAARAVNAFLGAASDYEGARVALAELTVPRDYDPHEALCLSGAETAALRAGMAEYAATNCA
jgi:hypothetical protein